MSTRGYCGPRHSDNLVVQASHHCAVMQQQAARGVGMQFEKTPQAVGMTKAGLVSQFHLEREQATTMFHHTIHLFTLLRLAMYRDMEMTFWMPETQAALAAVQG